MRNTSFYLLILLCVCTLPNLLHAQEKDITYTIADTAQARQLLKDAKKLTDERKYEEALEKAKLAKEILIKTLGSESEDVAESLNQIGIIFYFKNDDKQAELNLEKSLEIWLKLFGKEHLKIAQLYNTLGIIYKQKGLHQQAIEYHQQALDIRIKLSGEESKVTAESYENLGAAYNIQGNYEKAIQYHKKALEVFTKISGEDNQDVANSLNSLGMTYGNNSEYDKAVENLEKSLTIYLKLLPENHLALAVPYINLGSVYDFYGDFDKAIFYKEKGLRIRVNNLEENHPAVGRAYSYLAFSNLYKGEYDKALVFAEKSLEIQKQFSDGDNIGLASAYFNLGLIYYKKGDYNRAIEYNKKALEIKLHFFGANNPDIASAYNNLGMIYYAKNELDKALQFYQKALQLQIKVLGEEHIDVAGSYQNIGAIYSVQQKPIEAYKYTQKALELFIELAGEETYNVALAYNNLGAASTLEDDYEKAIHYFDKTLAINLKLFGEMHSDVGLAYHNLGEAYRNKQEYQKSIEFFKKAEKIDLETLGSQHPTLAKNYWAMGWSLKNLREYDKANEYFEKSLSCLNFNSLDSLYRVSSIAGLITALNEKGLFQYEFYLVNSQNKYLKEAYNTFQNVNGVINYQLKNTDFISISELNSKARGIYSNMMPVNYLLYQLTDSIHYLTEGFTFAERSKAYLLYQSMQESNALQFAGIPDTLLQDEYDLRVNLSYYEKKRQEKLDEGLSETDTTVLAYSSRVFDLRQEYETLKKRFETEFPEYYRLKYDLSVVSVEETQQLLQPDQTLLEYFVGDSSIFVFVVNKDSFSVQEVKKDFQLDSLVQSFRKGIYAQFDQNSQNTADSIYYQNPDFAIQQYTDAAVQLYEKLVAPVESQLRQRLIIVPDGVLGYLPFQALLKTKPEKPSRFHLHQYFGSEHPISYCYSATLLREMMQKQHKQTPEKSVLAVAPFYDGTQYMLDSIIQKERENLAADLGEDFSIASSDNRNALIPLPHSGDEANKTKALWKGDLLLKQDATEKNFTDLAGQYRILHLASHGKANDKVGDYSYLAFTEIKDSIENEKLFVKDLYNLQLNADLVVLSACETGIGELQRGEGIVSLARAFAYAGAKSIVTTLWQVNDEKTKDLMVRFHKNLKEGEAKDVALWKAQTAYLKKHTGEAANPFFWAAFIGIGDMGAIR